MDSKLKDLLNRNVIDQRLHNWSSVIRKLGNEGAHGVGATLTREDAEDAEDALSFLEALVNYLYTFQRRYEEYLERHPDNPTAATAPLVTPTPTP